VTEARNGRFALDAGMARAWRQACAFFCKLSDTRMSVDSPLKAFFFAMAHANDHNPISCFSAISDDVFTRAEGQH